MLWVLKEPPRALGASRGRYSSCGGKCYWDFLSCVPVSCL